MIISVTISDNRENEIDGAIRSVVDHVDRVLIIDTGITDLTLIRAAEVAGEKLFVIKHEWIDFSVARNFGIDSAESAGANWIALVDSDERLSFGETNLRSELDRAHADVLLIESDDGFYSKEKFLRSGSGSRFFGPTHEALIGGSRASLRGITFGELPKSNEQLRSKFTRDVGLLTSFITKHPDDPRWRYYLGQSLEGLEQRERAAEAFGKCVELRRFGYEAAWAAYKQAEQLFLLGRFEESIIASARGVGADASFAECAWLAAVSASRLGRNDQAVAWARMSESVGRYKGCGTERAWFKYLPALYELPYDVLRSALPDEAGKEEAHSNFQKAQLARVQAFSIEKHDLDRISVSRTTPESNRDEARSLLRPPTISDFCPSSRAKQIQFEPPGGRLPMNPSICLHNGEMWCVVRAVNYSMSGRSYTIHDPNNVIRTENYLGRLLEDGRLENPTLMRDLDPSPRKSLKIVGYEDVRLVSLKTRNGNILSGSATVCDRDREGRRQIARLHLDSNGNVERADIQHTNQEHEKNWMPISIKGDITWIYSLDPTAILPGPLWDCPLQLDHLRGGAAIQFDRGYLCVTHEVVEDPGGRIYLHRFVRLDNKFKVVSVSPSWVFAHHGIEFCAGLAISKGKAFLSYGVDDREAWVMQIDVDEIRNMKWITP